MPTDAQGLWCGLIDDAAMFPPGNAPLPQAITAHHDHQRATYAPLVGPLLCSDRNLRELGESVAEPLQVGLIVTGGAGAIGPAVQHASSNEYVDVVAVEIALRDEDDLARNAERIVRMLEIELPDGAYAAVEVPRTYDRQPTGSWWEALDVIAAAEHRLKLRTGGEHPDAHPSEQELARFIDAALDRECAFKLTAGLHHAVRNTDAEHGYEQHGFCNVLLATRALFDGATTEDAEQLLAVRDADQVAAELRGWDDSAATSARRWFTSLGSCSIAEPVADLTEMELIA
ncbi:hypothetical protein [Solicola gregarius]|uniref:Uncharacterized protein n=1 Tax=Solicola gregarius TaxID=2908642 RepID=A0AA46TE45_9ACTN|nr:hypothetical protein [Solicola gregarius]UYM03535.1 hypothetical protein L0C25_13310 [Solicola gregarius]